VKKDIDALEAEAAKPVPLRLMDWLGRMHPFLVHFPLALFPVGLAALIMARRRGSELDVIRALIVVGGAAAAGQPCSAGSMPVFTLSTRIRCSPGTAGSAPS
jgi:hypothetical protein